MTQPESPAPRRSARRPYLIGLLALAIAGAASYAATLLARLPSPPMLIGLALDLRPPSGSHQFFDAAPIAAPPAAQPLDEQILTLTPQIPWRDGATLNLAQFIKKTHTNALLVVHRDRLVYESYAPGTQRATVFPSYSVAKSMLSDLVGVAVRDGKIALTDPVSKYLPDIPQKFAAVTIDDLLNMRSGIQVIEKYDSAFSQIAYLYVTTDLARFVRGLNETAIKANAGFDYRSIDYQLLGMALAAATREPLHRYLQDKLWQPMGAAFPASWSVDSSAHSVEKSFCCVNARAVDFARYGMLRLRKGKAGDTQVLPAGWMRRPPEVGAANADFGYGRGWWLPRNTPAAGVSDGGDYTAIGIHGQYIYIDPASDTVIVKLSDHGAEQDEALTVGAFRRIVASLPTNG